LKDLFLNYWTLLTEKVFELSSYYGVDPLIFGLLYAGTIPLLWFSIGWIIRNIQKKQPIIVPLVAAALCVTGTYIYLLFAGQNIPLWVYGFAAGMVGFSGYNIHKKVSCKLEQSAENAGIASNTGDING
jgi:hypothetical protein